MTNHQIEFKIKDSKDFRIRYYLRLTLRNLGIKFEISKRERMEDALHALTADWINDEEE